MRLTLSMAGRRPRAARDARRAVRPGRRTLPALLLLAAALAAVLAAVLAPARARAEQAGDFARVFPEADRFGPMEGEPPAAPAYRSGRLAGYVFFSRSVVGSTGYSGKPLDLAIGLGLDGRITGVSVVEQHEPILILGIDAEDLQGFVDQYRGLDIRQTVRLSQAGDAAIDGLSGATVTSMILHEAVLRSARIVGRSRGLLEAAPGEAAGAGFDRYAPATWQELAADGSVACLALTHAEVDRAFAAQGVRSAAPGGISPDPQGLFIELCTALATPARIGRNLLGDAGYNRLMESLAPGDQVLFVAGRGLYSFKGTAFVRSGVFDRLQLVQGAETLRLRADQQRLLEALPIAGAPEFREIGLFVLPAASGFDAARPWRIELLAARQTESGEPARISFTLPYALPESYRAPPAAAPGQAAGGPAAAPLEATLWPQIWRERAASIAILGAALIGLTVLLILQDRVAQRPRLYDALRIGGLCFTLFWLGWYAGAQLSVVNVLTFVNALRTDFRWEFFLLDPLIFILWCYVAIALLFWGRVFCGWLCPFGALQELLNRAARALRIPQVGVLFRVRSGDARIPGLRIPDVQVPFDFHERLWPIKYVAFLALLGVSLASMERAVVGAEIEPFKTAIALKFVREWPFVAYAGLLLFASLFIERFFCRYLCPLGAALAIPGRVRMFEWLKRHRQCGTECQICARRCPVQSIHRDGHINPNECIYCLKCQMLYYHPQICPAVIARRKRREARAALRHKAGGEEAR